MDLFTNLQTGLGVAASPSNLLYCFIGCVLGTFIGVLPGLGPSATIAMLLPITFSMDPTASLIMLAGIYYGAQYGGSTTAILVNLPGEASSVVTALDGHQMARKGQAGLALSTAAIGSFIAGTIATMVIALFAPTLASIALKFGAADYFSVMILGLLASIVLAQGSLLKALAMIVLGLLAGLVGTDINSGVNRFTFDLLELSDGIDIVAAAMGVFGLAEIIDNLSNPEKRSTYTGAITNLLPTRSQLVRIIGPVLRGTGIGAALGVLPGGGALLSSFASYAVEKRISKEPERFGTGAIEGIAGPESANNAGSQTSFIPMLTLGIPSNVVMALMVGAMIIHGVQPGPAVIREQPNLFWGLIASMWLGNLMLLVLNLPLVGVWVRLLSIPYKLLFPAVMVFTAIGVFSLNNSNFDIYVMVFFGLLGYFLRVVDCEPAPFFLALVLSPMIEQYFSRALMMSRGDLMTFVERPISGTLLASAAILLVLAALPSVRRKRDEALKE
ncbi:tripartite tricarboxylate transporter permease [Microvirga soli]|uniref:tripartite tricarboxylate transporter permease n=1 Tax=Microvirga soli TaxID=1854496 RepID=UPI00191D0A5C|nr:tripartite tricarboxylate transporter permease [Microvirga soli]